MIKPGFLSSSERCALIELARYGLALHREARRANAIVLLDDGMTCDAIARVLLMDGDTIREWYRLYRTHGIDSLTNFHYQGTACRLSDDQCAQLKAWVEQTLPRTSGEIGQWIETKFDIVYEQRGGLTALLHRLGLEYRKPDTVSSKMDPKKQAKFIEDYNKVMNGLGANDAVLFGDAMHPTHAVRPVGCWGPKEIKVAVEQNSGRQRLNIHGAVDLETGKTCMLEVETVNAISTIMLLTAIEAMYPTMGVIHLFLDNARYHHARQVRAWLSQPGRRIKLHFVPPYCPHLNSIERLWGVMHKNVTHNRCYETFADFKAAILTFLCDRIPKDWSEFCDQISDCFRIITPADFRILK